MFTRPTPMRADVAIDIGSDMDTVVTMLACHASQFFDWLPYNLGVADQVPVDAAARLAWLRKWYEDVVRPRADRYRGEIAATVEFVEMFEISEYARPLNAELRERLFGAR
jgi:hypothetical protein